LTATLYGIPASHPCAAIELALRLKGVDYRRVDIPPIAAKAVIWRKFGRLTVPGVEFGDGERVHGSRAILRALEHRAPDPPLLPADGRDRRVVEEAERWGDEVLQDVPRRIVRWLSVHRPETRVMIAREIGVPLPRFAAWINAPSARYMANKVDSDREINNAIGGVGEVLDHVDDLIEHGVIGGEAANAADFQIATSVRALLTVRDLDRATKGRPAAEHAMRLVPEFGNDFPAGLLPADVFRAPERS
jgi:glutathione S-transferase